MKRVLLLATGGTIATQKTAQGLVPQLTSQQLLSCIPEIESLCHVDTLQLFNLDSTNLSPAHWIAIAQAIREHYAQYDSFVISHGTDTMAYTAAALSYLIQGGTKPIVLTGARIGNNCLVGAGALVTGKMDVPDGSLVLGNPAKVIRPLTAAEIAENVASRDEYLDMARRCRAGRV